MQPLKINKPFKHFVVSQKWGRYDPIYEQFGFKRHNGIDCLSSYNDQWTSYNPKKWPIYCPVENFRVHMMRESPKGGGKEVWLLSKEPLQMQEKVAHAYLGFAHNDTIFVKVGDELELGDMFCISDNTGAASSGPHSHIGLYRVDWDGKIMTFLDKNDANNSFDPMLFMTSEYAIDKASLATLIKSNVRYYQYLMGIL